MNMRGSVIVAGISFFVVLSCFAAASSPPLRSSAWPGVRTVPIKSMNPPVVIAEAGKIYLVKAPRIVREVVINHGILSVLPTNKIAITCLNGGRVSLQLAKHFNIRVRGTNERHVKGSAFCFHVNPRLYIISLVPVDPKIDPMGAPSPVAFNGVIAAPTNHLPASSGMTVFRGMSAHTGEVGHMKVRAGHFRTFGR